MKKIVAVILCILFVFQLQASFAQRISIENKIKAQVLKEIQQLTPEIRSNNTSIQKLKSEAKKEYLKAKNKIKRFIDHKEALTIQQIEELRESLLLLKEKNNEINQTQDQYSISLTKLRKASTLKDLEMVRDQMENIVQMQSMRILQLKNIVEELKKIKEL